MAKAIYICLRDNLEENHTENLIRRRWPAGLESTLTNICRRNEPDNINANTPLINCNGSIAYGIINPVSTIRKTKHSLMLGMPFDSHDEWMELKSDPPDGSYALFRADEMYVEVASDPAGSRTIWTYSDEDLFVASTSQRALVMLLGEFQFNTEVVPWILSSGSLGPVHGWDRRFRRVPPDTILTLHRQTWNLERKSRPVTFGSARRSIDGHKQALRESIDSTIRNLKLKGGNWQLPLSGGYDSRGLLLFLLEKNRTIQTLTYGLKKNISKPGNDVSVAFEVADVLGVDNHFYPTDLSDEPIATIVRRFLTIGEGATDNIAGYLDGFFMWSELFNDGVEGILRGDEGFGWNSGTKGWSCKETTIRIRESVSLYLMEDFYELNGQQTDGIANQIIPEYLVRQPKESFEDWRDRLYHQYRLPVGLAALNDLKFAYLEQASPFLSRKILEVVRTLPHEERTDKRAFRRIVDSICPEISYATKGGGPYPGNFFAWPKMTEFLKDSLESNSNVIPKMFVKNLIKNLRVASSPSSNSKGMGNNTVEELQYQKKSKSFASQFGDWKKGLLTIKKTLFHVLRAVTGNRIVKKRLDPNRLAFRVYMVEFMYDLLEDDARKVAEMRKKHDAHGGEEAQSENTQKK